MPHEEYMTREEHLELFKEWDEDYHAARVRDYGGDDAATYGQRIKEGAMTPHPWPSEIAQENQRKPAGQDQGKSGGNERANERDDGFSM